MASWIPKKKIFTKKDRSNGSPGLEDQDRSSEQITQETVNSGVQYIPVRCPRCGSKDQECYSSRPPIRYHKCRKCELRFKSIEAE